MNKNIKKIFLVALISIVSYATVVPHPPGPVHSHVPRTYKVNLDDPV